MSKRIAIITHDTLPFAQEMEGEIFSFPPGEKHKRRETKERLEDALFAAGFGRDTMIIGLGGGVVCDMAGFLASTFCRGVPLTLIPTTLLAMVDASIGGKNGVNTPHGKNLIGTFYMPTKVIRDYNYLKSLPDSEIRNGMAEIIKAGLIASPSLFSLIEREGSLEEMIEGAIAIKEIVIEEDFRESGKRAILNFGHTVGHALEKVMNYRVSHGEAVRFGMVCEAEMGGLFDPRIEALCNPKKFDVSVDALIEAMKSDKKCIAGTPRITTLSAIGKVKNIAEEIPEKRMREVLHAHCAKAATR